MNSESFRRKFPFFSEHSDAPVYLDNAATTQKPREVLDRLINYYSFENSNIHRGAYPLSRKADRSYEHSRETVQRWIDARESSEIIFTKGSTEASNLLAYTLFQKHIQEGDNVVVTELEHSSNYFPWMEGCRRKGAEFRIAEAERDGTLTTRRVLEKFDQGTKLLAITAMSNVTGFRPELREIIAEAHKRKILVYVDAAQFIAHSRISVQELDCDFLCFSGHKLYGPMGIGALYARKECLEELPPFLYGGDMLEPSEGGGFRYKNPPFRFEAGTQNIGAALGLEAAIQCLEGSDFEELRKGEAGLSEYLRKELRKIRGLHIFGQVSDSSPVLAFSLDGLGAYDVGILLGNKNIAVRCGNHCAYPLTRHLRQEGTVRVSIAFYNTVEDADLFLEALRSISARFSRG